MKRLMLGMAAAGIFAAGMSVSSFSAQQTDPQPTCRMCEGTYLPATEIQEYLKKALAEGRVDQQARDSTSAKRMSPLASFIAVSLTHRRRTRSPSMIWSARSITSCRVPARSSWVRISRT